MEDNSLGSFFTTSIASTEALYAVTSTTADVANKFELRKKLYENKELFYKIHEDINPISIPEDIKEELDSIQDSVKKGRDFLKSELEINKQLTQETMNLKEFEERCKAMCLECQQLVNRFETMFIAENFDTNDLKNHVDETIYAIGEIFQLVDSNVQAKSTSLKKKMDDNNSKLKYMMNTYDVLKNTTLGHLCPICLTSEVDIFCDPCGHTFCTKCMRSSYCYMCRLRINRINPLYFS